MFNEAVVLIEVLLMVYLEHPVEQERRMPSKRSCLVPEEDVQEECLRDVQEGVEGGKPVSFSGWTDSGLG